MQRSLLRCPVHLCSSDQALTASQVTHSGEHNACNLMSLSADSVTHEKCSHKQTVLRRTDCGRVKIHMRCCTTTAPQQPQRPPSTPTPVFPPCVSCYLSQGFPLSTSLWKCAGACAMCHDHDHDHRGYCSGAVWTIVCWLETIFQPRRQPTRTVDALADPECRTVGRKEIFECL